MRRCAALHSAHSVTRPPVVKLRSLWCSAGASEWHEVVALVFRAHGVLPLLLAGVRVTVGTDSEGVEHTSMKGEYMTIAAVIAGYRACTAAVSLEGIPTYAARYVSHSRALKAEHEAACSVSAVPVPEIDLSVQLLFQYQHEHLSWMQQRPGGPMCECSST